MPALVIVVVNHDAIFLNMMGNLLAIEGYRPLCLHADGEAFHRLRVAQPALAVLDISVHQRDTTWALVERVHRDPATAHIPVIVCTGDVAYARERLPDILEYRYALLEKPFEINDLLRRIEEMTGR
jgi:CheY-like chemotaxis protein